MSCLSRHWIRSPIWNRDDISFLFSFVPFFDRKEVQSDFALKRDEAFLDYDNFWYKDQKGSSIVDDDLWMLVTSFDCWCPKQMKKIVDIGDQSGQNRRQYLIIVTS